MNRSLNYLDKNLKGLIWITYTFKIFIQVIKASLLTNFLGFWIFIHMIFCEPQLEILIFKNEPKKPAKCFQLPFLNFNLKLTQKEPFLNH